MQICFFPMKNCVQLLCKLNFATCACVYACGETNELLRLASRRFSQVPPPSTRLNFDFAMKIPTPINFACKLSSARACRKFLFPLLLEQAFPREKPIMQSEMGRKISLVSYSLPVIFNNWLCRLKFLPKELRSPTHTQFRFLSIRVQSWCQLPASCMSKPKGENAREPIHFSSSICIIKNHFSSWQWLKRKRINDYFPVLLFGLGT